MEDLHSWILGEFVEGSIPEIDRVLMFLPKIGFLFLRRTARITLGQKRRDKIRRLQMSWISEYESPTYRFYISLLKRYKGSLVRIRVPKYGYSYLCRTDRGDYTPKREVEILANFTPEQGDVVVDVGAHIGKYTIISSKAVGAKGKVIAIEAASENFEMLKRNIELNRLVNVLPIHCALYSKKTKLKLYRPTTSQIYNSVMVSRADQAASYEEVDSFTLDEILSMNNIDRVNWVKIDVEGAEFEVLKGAGKTLARNPALSILLEVHKIDDPNHYDKILELLNSFRFRPAFEMTYLSGERHVIFRQ